MLRPFPSSTWLVLSLCACSAGRSPAPADADRVAAHAQRCPADTALARRALGTDLAVELVSCAPGYFGHAGFAVVAWVGKGTDQAVLHRLVVLGDGTLLADAARGATYHETRGEERSVTKQVRAEDLDGDGIDEVIEETQYTRSAGRVGDLAVYTLASGVLVRVGDLQISYDDSAAHPDLRGATLCEGRWTARGTPVALVIEREFATGPKTEQCVDGRFGLRDRQLVRM